MSVSKQHSLAAPRKSGNTLNPRSKKSAGQKLAEAQARVDRVLAELDQCATRKLREMMSELREIRGDFNALKKGQTISDCRNWAEFCKQRLHRTKQAVNQLLAGKPERKETFHLAAQAEEGPPADPAPEISDDPSTEDRAEAPASAARNSTQTDPPAYDKNLDQANKKLRHFFRPFEEPEDIAKKLNEILVHQYPSRKFIVTVEEVFTDAPAPPRTYNYEQHPGTPTGVARVRNVSTDERYDQILAEKAVEREIANGEVGF